MSRFFRGNESSDSESEASSTYSSSESEADFAPAAPKSAARPAARSHAQHANRFAIDLSDSEEEEEKRVVKSKAEKLLDEVDENSNSICMAIRVGRWTSVPNAFEKMTKSYDKLQKSNKTESLDTRPYFRCLAKLEDALTTPSDKSKMNANDSRAYNQMKQRVLKHNKKFATQIKEYRQNPIQSDEESEAEALEVKEEMVKEEEKSSTKVAGAAKFLAAGGSKASMWR
ncbi:hypothetical protein EV182_005689, partial [Spiromyces aspiralis]